MKKFQVFKRIRKPTPSPLKYLRLNRAEYGSTFKRANYDFENYYPDIDPLINIISKYYRVNNDCIYLGAGGESIIRDLFLLMFLKQKKNIFFNRNNFFMYTYYSNLFCFKKFNYLSIPDNNNIYMTNLLLNLKKKKIDLMVIVNPSHPFENFLSTKEITKILNVCKRKKTFVLLDEVYLSENKLSAINLINKFENLVILKSLSKVPGSPGLRVAYAFAQKKIINELNSVKLAIELPEYNIRKAIKFFNSPNKYIDPKINNINEARKYANKEFKKRNIKSYGKYGNSVSAVLNTNDNVLKLGKYLEKNKVLINYKYSSPFEKFINITTTNKKNLEIFFKLFDKCFS